jgi:hypothetical protein
VHGRDLLRGVGQWLAPERVDVGLRAADGVRRVARPAEREPDPRLLVGADVEGEVLEGVVLAREVPG